MKATLNGENTVALLIDGDNVSSKFIDPLERRISALGRITHKRLYYTYNGGIIPNGWAEKITDNSLNPVIAVPHTNGAGKAVKNAADFKLNIEAMEIMYKGINNVFVIVSSDSDFTSLVTELKENGIYVFGAGEKHTSAAFIRACDDFGYLEDLQKLYSTERVAESVDGDESVEEQQPEEISADDEQAEDADCDPEFNGVRKSEIERYIADIFEQSGESVLNAGYLNLKVLKRYPDFNCKNYGYARFKQFLDGDTFKIVNHTEVRYISK